MHNKQQANAIICQHKHIHNVITVGSIITDYYYCWTAILKKC